MSWKFENYAPRLDFPAEKAFTITPSDANDLSEPVRALYVGTDGDIKITAYKSSTPVVLTGLVAGSIIPILVKKVWSESTTVTTIVGLG